MEAHNAAVPIRRAFRRFNLGLIGVALGLIAFCLAAFLVLNLMDRSNERAHARAELRRISVEQVLELERLRAPLTHGEPVRKAGETTDDYRKRLEAWAETQY